MSAGSYSPPTFHSRRQNDTQSTAVDLPFSPHTYPIIPPPRHPARPDHFRTLVLCFDGTGDQFDNDNSNIVQFFSCLKKGDISQQLVYYQAGIGTYTTPQIATPLLSSVSKTLDLALGSSLNHHVMGGYEFLMENYREGDRISIFGFSRGAYTARALAGMLHKVGLLPNGNHQQVPFAYHMFTKNDKWGWEQSRLFKQTFSINVHIDFIGVFDTVDSVGIIPKTLPFTKSNRCIRVFRHALALDEHRAKFRPTFYQFPTEEEDKWVGEEAHIAVLEQARKKAAEALKKAKQAAKNGNGNGNGKGKDSQKDVAGTNAVASMIEDVEERFKQKNQEARAEDHSGHDDEHAEATDMYEELPEPTDVEEVFFSGCHCDVGGGAVPNDTRHSLARIPLRWMIRECFKANTGIQFDSHGLRALGLDPAALWPNVKPRPEAIDVWNVLDDAAADHHALPGWSEREWEQGLPTPDELGVTQTGKHVHHDSVWKHPLSLFGYDDGTGDRKELSEELEDFYDALCPMYDQLQQKWAWWVLEFFPVKEHTQVLREDDDKKATWVRATTWNLGRPRVRVHQHRLPGGSVKVHRTVLTRMNARAAGLLKDPQSGVLVKVPQGPDGRYKFTKPTAPMNLWGWIKSWFVGGGEKERIRDGVKAYRPRLPFEREPAFTA